jgi:hypothetical protein
MLSELEKQRDALRQLVTQTQHMLLLTRCHADSNSPNGDAASVAPRRPSFDAQTMTPGIASLFIAVPSSRTLSELEERREALQELLAHSKGTPMRVLWSRIR